MAVVFDRVKETSTSTGTGVIALSGASPSFQAFGNVLSVGEGTFYAIVDATSGSWETGEATYSDTNELTRTKVLESSNSGNVVNFGAGTKNVFMTYPASQSITSSQSIALSIALG